MPYNRPYRNSNRDRSRRRRERLNAALRRLAQEDDEEDFIDIPLAQTMPAIEEEPEREAMEDETSTRTMVDRGSDADPILGRISNRATTTRNFADVTGGETQLTPVPGPYPTWLPETMTITHKGNFRLSRYQVTDGSGTLSQNSIFDHIWKPYDIEGFFSSMDGTPGAATGSYDVTELSMYQYCKNLYEYFHVIATRVTFECTDWHVLNQDPLSTTRAGNSSGGQWPDMIYFETHYSSDAPKTRDQTALADSPYMSLLGLRNVRIIPAYEAMLKQEVNDETQRKQKCIIKRTYTKADYNKIMDITTDAENTIWTASGGSPTLPFNVRLMPRWKEPVGEAAAVNLWHTVYVHVEFDTQWKQISTEMSGGYWNVPDFHV